MGPPAHIFYCTMKRFFEVCARGDITDAYSAHTRVLTFSMGHGAKYCDPNSSWKLRAAYMTSTPPDFTVTHLPLSYVERLHRL